MPSGITEGVTHSMGEYDECLNIESDFNSQYDSVIKGQYCMANVVIPYPDTESSRHLHIHIQQLIDILNYNNGKVFKIGICIPSQCSAEEIQNTINQCIV